MRRDGVVRRPPSAVRKGKPPRHQGHQGTTMTFSSGRYFRGAGNGRKALSLAFLCAPLRLCVFAVRFLTFGSPMPSWRPGKASRRDRRSYKSPIARSRCRSAACGAIGLSRNPSRRDRRSYKSPIARSRCRSAACGAMGAVPKGIAARTPLLPRPVCASLPSRGLPRHGASAVGLFLLAGRRGRCRDRRPVRARTRPPRRRAPAALRHGP